MKKTCIQILLIVFAFTARAQISTLGSKSSLLSITNLSAEDLLFEVDGQQYPDCNNNLNLRGLKPGNHLVKVYSGKAGGVLNMKRVVIYNKNVYVKPQFYVDIIVNRFGRIVTDEQSITGNQYDNDGRNDWKNPNVPNNPNYPNNQNNPTTPNNPNYLNNPGNPNNSGNNWPPRNDYNNPPRPMADNTFSSFVETIRHESFDDSRMAISRAGIDQNFFTSAQAKTLLSVFSFEASKLEIAKYMYGKTTDPKNYFVVYNVFTFSKSKEELAEYVRTYK